MLTLNNKPNYNLIEHNRKTLKTKLNSYDTVTSKLKKNVVVQRSNFYQYIHLTWNWSSIRKISNIINFSENLLEQQKGKNRHFL